MTPVDVRIEHVWKQYRLGARRSAATFWALRDVTVDVPRGSSFGIIGANGAGKSTLLKLLAGITAPTRGRITIDGRLAALIEVGSGFHPELTGRENVFLSGAILGMRQKEIASKLPSIVEFAGVNAFIDTPVKWYSSGMYVRLGFSIAAHLEPDVLLVDEVLAVGDAEFQAKCLRRIRELRSRGVTILFISHDLTTVEQLCDSAVLLEKGEVAASGDPAEVVSVYHRRLTAGQMQSEEYSDTARDGLLTITSLLLRDPLRPSALTGRTGHPLTVALRCQVARPLPPVVVQLSYYSADGRTLVARTETDAPLDLPPPGGIVEFTCAELPLRQGAYCVTAAVRDAASNAVITWWDGSTTLHVEPGVTVEGQFHVPHTWRTLPLTECGATPPRPGESAEERARTR
jgi:ABC-type polysaccharide/polyol phosphate transport system ATPase subunit